MLNIHGRAAVQDVHPFQNKMVGVSKDFVSGDHYDALLTLLDEDLLNADEDFPAELADVVTKIVDLPSTQEFKCEVCEKMCKSQQGISRHKNAKYVSSHSHAHNATEVRVADSMLNQQLINECAKKLSCDEGDSLPTMNSLKPFYISLDETSHWKCKYQQQRRHTC